MNIGFCVAVILQTIFICRPLAFNWDQSMKGSCGDQKRADLALGILNLAFDLTTFLLPMPILWGLQMPRRKKIALSGIFGMGLG